MFKKILPKTYIQNKIFSKLNPKQIQELDANKKTFSEKDCYYFEYHGKNSINKEIYHSGGSYYNREKKLAKASSPLGNKDSYFKYEYDFFNSNIKSESDFAKNYRNQVLAICLNQNLLNDQSILNQFIPEAIEKAKKYMKVKMGAYSCAKGVESVRKNIVNFISNRDKFQADPEDIFLTYGGIDAYHHVLGLIFNREDEIIVPSPCYPVYLAYNKSLNLKNIFYHTNSNGVDLVDLHNKLNNNFNGCETKTQRPKAMVVINPNNPTGRLLSKEEMEEIVIFCVENKLALIASEVLQDLVYEGEFLSFRNLINQMPTPYNKLELFSTHSASKSNLFNSGARAGYLNLLNIAPEVKAQLYKHISMDICSALPGQIMMDLTLTPPSEEEGIFNDDFIKRYNESIQLSKRIHKNIVQNVGDNLANSKLFTFNQPNAGFTFFINLSIKEICKSKNHRILRKLEPLCDIYANNLFKETQILCTPGNDYGNFPNSIVINLCNHFKKDTIEKLLDFNDSFINKIMDV